MEHIGRNDNIAGLGGQAIIIQPYIGIGITIDDLIDLSIIVSAAGGVGTQVPPLRSTSSRIRFAAQKVGSDSVWLAHSMRV